jgi:cbb3-type cytochrome oxidase subunit 3
MRCPRCQSTEFQITASCSRCQFQGDTLLLERLSNVQFLLDEIKTWPQIPPLTLQDLQKRYEKQQRHIEVELGLRPPPPNEAEAHELRLALSQWQSLLDILPRWLYKDWLETAVANSLEAEAKIKQAEIQAQLLDAPPPPDTISPLKQTLRQWEQKKFLLTTIEQLDANGQITKANYQTARAELAADILALEIKAGLRPADEVAAGVGATAPIAAAASAAAAKPEPAATADTPPRPPRIPWTWDRVWETLLSERTLQAILFLGVLLLFAAGVSWVAWNWDTFAPLAQVAFLAGFTTLFYGLGWYVYRQMNLPDSGMALIAVGSLLLPLDFYAFYLSGGFPPDSWPQVWLLASAVCLVVYLLVVAIIQAEFFGYLIGVAAGSLAAAALNLVGVHVYWQQTGLALVAALLALSSEGLRWLRPLSLWRVLIEPFGRLALAAVIPIMVVGLGWGLIDQIQHPIFLLALALNWWLGGLVLLPLARRYRLRSVGLAAALVFPMAVWLTQRWLFQPAAVAPAWHALGWTLLLPFYLLLGWYLAYRPQNEPDEIERAYGQTAVGVGGLLAGLAAFWSLGNASAAALVHLLLAANVLLALRLWQQPRLMWPVGLFLVTATAAWQGGRGAAPAELALPWALLSILYIVVALQVERLALSDKLSQFSPLLRHSLPVLYGTALITAALALMPPLLLWDQSLLVYALLNWIGLNGWLAYLAHGYVSNKNKETKNAGLQLFLAQPRLRGLGSLLFHWAAALAVVPWLWLVWTNMRPAAAPLALIFAVAGWGLLWLCLRLRRLDWSYGRPWSLVAHFSNTAALLTGFFYYEQAWLAAVLLLVGTFYLAAARLLHRREWLYAGGLLWAGGWLLGLDWLGLAARLLNPALALLALTYLLAAAALERYRAVPRALLMPLYHVALGLTAVVFIRTAAETAWLWHTTALAWVALAPLLLGLSFGLTAWLFNQTSWAYLAVWQVALAGALFVKVSSQGSGRSAALIALIAIAYVLSERGLHYLALNWRDEAGQAARYAWRLFRRPLLATGWAISLVAIAAALIRNMVWLGGDFTRQSWAIVALLLITALYALSARLFRHARFVWLASILVIFPWTLLTDLGWYVGSQPPVRWHSVSWLILALLLTAVAVALARRLGMAPWGRPPLVVAHWLVPLAWLWGLPVTAVAVWSLGLAILFYLVAVTLDRHYGPKQKPARARFLYPAAFLMPVWAVYLLFYFWPTASLTTTGLLLWVFALPALAVGYRLSTWEPGYRWPFYLLAYGTAVVATLWVWSDQPVLITFLLLNTGLAILSVWLFREPVWWFAAAVSLTGAALFTLDYAGVALQHYYGWALITLGAVYWLGVLLLSRLSLPRYTPPLIAAMFVSVLLGLPAASMDRVGALVGYGLAALVYGSAAVWLRWPFVMSVAAGLAIVPYCMVVLLLGLPAAEYGLALWPGILVALLLARYLDDHWGREPFADGSKVADFPWHDPVAWAEAFINHWGYRWAYGWYGVAFLGIFASALLAVASPWRWFLVLVAGTAVFAWTTFRFRWRGWLLLAGIWAQFTALALIRWAGWTTSPAQIALAFMPVTILTAVAGLFVEKVRREGPPLAIVAGRLRLNMAGWSRPFYALLAVNLLIGQFMTLLHLTAAGPVVTLLNGLVLLLLATAWQLAPLAYAPPALGLLALFQALAWYDSPSTTIPVALAVLAVVYGLTGYGLQYGRQVVAVGWQRTVLWERPLRLAGWAVSGLALLSALGNAPDLPAVVLRFLFIRPVFLPVELPQVEMVILVLAILGLFYLAAALAERVRWLGYAALVLLLAAWSLWLLLIQGQRELQLYAIPAAAYLLGVGWLEWQFGSRALARWLDRAALLLLFGSVFWQSLGFGGGAYALLMIVEGLLVAWLGSWRRLRRLLYAGVVGVVTAVTGQLIEPLLALDTFVLLLLGALLVALGIALERRLEKVRDLSKELRLKLEDWD